MKAFVVCLVSCAVLCSAATDMSEKNNKKRGVNHAHDFGGFQPAFGPAIERSGLVNLATPLLSSLHGAGPLPGQLAAGPLPGQLAAGPLQADFAGQYAVGPLPADFAGQYAVGPLPAAFAGQFAAGPLQAPLHLAGPLNDAGLLPAHLATQYAAQFQGQLPAQFAAHYAAAPLPAAIGGPLPIAGPLPAAHGLPAQLIQREQIVQHAQPLPAQFQTLVQNVPAQLEQQLPIFNQIVSPVERHVQIQNSLPVYQAPAIHVPVHFELVQPTPAPAPLPAPLPAPVTKAQKSQQFEGY